MDQQGATHPELTAVVTTGNEGREPQERAAKELAARYGLRFVPRNRRNLQRIHADEQVDIVAVLTEPGMVLHRGEHRLPYGTGLAEVRIQRVLKGELEPLVKLLAVAPGLRVLDCTLGFGRDALVMAAAGAEVEGVESMPLVAAFVDAGLQRLTGAGVEATRRVRVIRADYRDVLREAKDASYHAVYFDPMFGEVIKDQPDYELFRALADSRRLEREDIEQARRVARQVVVIKDGPRAALLKSIGLPLKELTFGTRVRYGVVEAETARSKR